MTATIETPEARETSGTSTQEQEPTYESDLRGLVALAQQREKLPPQAEEPIGLDAPPSVREAIRAAGALLPTPATAPAHRLRLAVLPVLAFAIIVALVGTRRSLHWDRSLLPATPVAEGASPIPPWAEAFSPPRAPSSKVAAEPPSRVDEAPDVPSPPPTAPPVAAHPRLRAPTRPRPSVAAPTPSVTIVPDVPSLMQAITDAVRTSPAAQDHPEHSQR